MNSIPPKEVGCHRTGFTKSCRELVVDGVCRRWTHLFGKDPQGEGTIDDYRCADDWLPILMVENSQMQRQTAASVDSFRNEMVKANERSIEILRAAASIGLLEATSTTIQNGSQNNILSHKK